MGALADRHHSEAARRVGLNGISDVPDGATVVVDSAPIIYYLEDRRPYAARFAPIFERAAVGNLRIAISTITLAEVLAGPLTSGNELLVEQYRAILTSSHGWLCHPVTESIAVVASRFRTRYRLRLPDAIQLATAAEVGAHALITHDRDFGRVKDFRIVS